MLGLGTKRNESLYGTAPRRLVFDLSMLVMWVAGNYPGAVADRPAEGPTQQESRC